MLNWWLGKPTDGINRVGEDEQEPPETPAPVFAARALKTAIFGTPAPPDDTVYENEKEAEEEGDGIRDAVIGDIMDPAMRNESPTKPPGILLTPGTGTTRRKTVSFGNEVVDNEGKNGIGRSGIPNNCPGKFPSPWSAKGESKSAKKTALTRTLESAREGKSGKVGLGMSGLRNEVVNSEDDEDGADLKEPKRGKGLSQNGDQDLMNQSITRDDFDGDMTLDLNEPHSQSGKYWKSNYDQYHEEAKAEMKKLLKYKQLAKSYAKKKDAEAIDLGQKLKEERRKVISMEEKISELGALIATNGITGSEDDSPELIKELARQTALTLQYKTLVDEFQDAYQENQGHTDDGMTEKRYATARNERALLEIQKELNRAREKLREMEDLRNEMHSLRLSLSAAERKNSRLQDENAKLSQDLKRANLQVEREEKRRQSVEEQRERRDSAFQALQDGYDNLKELSKKARQEDQELLKKRQEQVKELKKMVLTSQQEVRTCKQTIEQYKAAEDTQAAERKFFEPSPDKEIRSKSRAGETKQDPAARTIIRREEPRPRESAIPVLAASASKNAADTKTPQSNTPVELPRPRSSHAALSEVVNSASPDVSPVKKPGTSGLTPFVNRFSNMTLESPLMELPSPEPSLLAHSTNKAFDEKVRPSPRPSMFNIPSSPPKTMVPRPRPTSGLSRINGLSRQKSTSDLRQKSTSEMSEKATELTRQKSFSNLDGRQQPNMGSSRISSSDGSRARNTLPPERAAAARARLEQRMIEKKAKKAKEMDLDKENIR